ncbi:hypothetical protein [Paraburkholderia tropica]|uniref:hypothetical protein n=1 Tax=Paraburkholderia tropica TaxID=92647 RepID=UPI001F3588AC|nr:hypothetical protein [Paraburkholderia tropica]
MPLAFFVIGQPVCRCCRELLTQVLEEERAADLKLMQFAEPAGNARAGQYTATATCAEANGHPRETFKHFERAACFIVPGG